MAKFNCDVCKDTGIYHHGILLAMMPCPNGCKRPESNIGELAPVAPRERTIDDCETRRGRIAFILEDIAANGMPHPRDLEVAVDAIEAELEAEVYKPKEEPKPKTVMVVRNTRTVATMEVSSLAYNEIKEKLEAAGYGHALCKMPGGILLDMHGIGLMEEK